MPRLFVGNFDFEYELMAAGGASRRAPETVHSMSLALATAWLGLAEAEDYVLTTRPIVADDLPDLVAAEVGLPRFVTCAADIRDVAEIELVPWGWTVSAAALAAERGWRTAIPPLEVIRHVNSREFRLQLEQEFGVALPQAGVARSLGELRSLVAAAGELAHGWILKANFGMAGRESMRGRGAHVSDALARWVEKRLQSDDAIVFEPLLECVAEAGLQFDVPADAPPRLIGVAELIVDNSGVYRGSRFETGAGDRVATNQSASEGEQIENPSRESTAPSTADTRWEAAVAVGLQVARRLQSLGYFGPLGVDAMQYRDAKGQQRVRPLQDLNARFTLGRLALGFRRLVPPGWCASWLWLPARRRTYSEGPQWPNITNSGESKILRTSPADDTGQQPQSLLLLASSLAARAAAELWLRRE